MNTEMYVVCYNQRRAHDLFVRFINLINDRKIWFRAFKSGLEVNLDWLRHGLNKIRFMSEQHFLHKGCRGFHGHVVDEYEFERDLNNFVDYLEKEKNHMNTFIKIFSDAGCKGAKGLEDKVNTYAQDNNLEIVSASPCFRKGFLEPDGMFISVVFRKKDC